MGNRIFAPNELDLTFWGPAALCKLSSKLNKNGGCKSLVLGTYTGRGDYWCSNFQFCS